jgi:Lon protease-like protein
MTRIPLFPLGVVLLPGLPLPLHIFEKRYRELITECLRKDSEFGIVYYNGEDIQRAGCTAKITQVMKSTEEGKLDIMTVGVRRFTIHEIYEEKAYLEADVDFFDDEETGSEEKINELAEKGIQRLTRLARFTGSEQNLDFLKNLDVKPLSFILAGSSGFSMKERQRFLEMRSLRERLEKSSRSLSHLLRRAKIGKAVESIIGGNGHLKNFTLRPSG